MHQEIPFHDLNIPMEEIYSFMGYGPADVPDAETVRTTELLLADASAFLHPCFEYIFLDGKIDLETDRITLDGPQGPVAFDAGRIICRQLNSARRFAVFVATVGRDYFQWTDRIKARDDVFQTYVADCVGSQVAESAADYMERVLQTELDTQGLKRTNRYSPGYCSWHVSCQPALFSLFPEEHPCGIELTDSCLMLPVKSVSGIIGIGPDVRFLPYSCGICTMQQCFRRHRPATMETIP